VTDPKVRERQPHLTNNRVASSTCCVVSCEVGRRCAVGFTSTPDNRHGRCTPRGALAADLDERRRFAARIAALKANPSRAGVVAARSRCHFGGPRVNAPSAARSAFVVRRE
jgi:hypothetical protein